MTPRSDANSPEHGRPLTVRVYGDSLALPREDVGVAPEDTYGERLKAGLSLTRATPVLLFNRSRGGATVDVLQREFAADSVYFGVRTRGVLVVQCGIVDCAPRPIPRWLRSTIGRLPGRLRGPIVQVLHHNRRRLLGLGLAWRLTPPPRFRRELHAWLTHASGLLDEIYVCTIAPTTSAIEAHSPGLTASIDAYNAALADVVAAVSRTSRQARIALVDVHAAIAATDDPLNPCVSPADGHHLTAAGHRLYAATLLEAAQQAGRRPAATTAVAVDSTPASSGADA